MHLALLTSDFHIQQAVQHTAQQMGAHLSATDNLEMLYNISFDIILWHLTTSDDSLAKGIAGFDRPIILLLKREQVEQRLGLRRILHTPLPSLPDKFWYIVLPFEIEELTTLLTSIANQPKQ